MEGILSGETWGQCSQAEAQALGRPNPAHSLGAEIQAGSWDALRTFPWRVYTYHAVTGGRTNPSLLAAQ